jgi:hypothetical protein
MWDMRSSFALATKAGHHAQNDRTIIGDKPCCLAEGIQKDQRSLSGRFFGPSD